MRHQKVSNLILAAVIAIAGTMGAQAQTIGVGATKGGAVNQMATAISKVVSSHAGFQLRPIPMASTQALIPVVNGGELEFAMGNMMQVTMAVSGTGMSEGTKYENLRMVATMIPFRWGMAVRADSDIHTIADLRGKRIPHGHDAGPLFHFLYVGILANGGLTYDDVERVPVVLFREGWNAFKQGKVDVALTGVGSGIMKEMNATISGGIRYIPFDDSPAAGKRMLEQTPKTYFLVVEPAPGLDGVVAPTKLAVYDYTLYASTATPEDIVYNVVKAIYEHESEFKEAGALFRTYSTGNLSREQGIPYHPGAEKYYREAGAWNR
jgi:TRAP transporter TAXI family solute receptor